MIYPRELVSGLPFPPSNQTGKREFHIPIPYQSYMLACKVEILIPRRTVNKLAFEIVQARDSRPFPCIQNTTCINKNIARIIQNNTVDKILDFNVPFTGPVIPLGSDNLMRNFGLFAQVTPELESLEIIVYLGTWGVRA
jgi:hypothetical protein